MSNEALKLIDDCISRLEASKRVLLNQSAHPFKDMPVNQVLLDNQPHAKQWKIERTAPTLKAVFFFKDRSPASRIEHQSDESLSEFLTHLAKVIETESDAGYPLLDLNVVTQRHSEMTTVNADDPETPDDGIVGQIKDELSDNTPDSDGN